MDLRLKGHRAIVTGSSAGIGEAIARRLAAEGAAVIVHGRRAHAVSAVAEAITADGGQAEGLTADLADPGDCARLISGALAAGDVDILVNNAGAFANRGWDDAAPEDWLALYAVNVAAAVRCIQAQAETWWIEQLTGKQSTSAGHGGDAAMDVYYPWYMSLRRTNVYADADDLMLIKEAAARRGIPEAEIIREGIHLAAMSSRVWDEPLDWPTFEGIGQPALGDEVTRAVARGAGRS